MNKDTRSPPAVAAAEVDFPIERVEAEHVSRREFAKFLCLVSGGMAVGSGWVAVKDGSSRSTESRRSIRLQDAGRAGRRHTPFTLPGSAGHIS